MRNLRTSRYKLDLVSLCRIATSLRQRSATAPCTREQRAKNARATMPETAIILANTTNLLVSCRELLASFPFKQKFRTLETGPNGSQSFTSQFLKYPKIVKFSRN